MTRSFRVVPILMLVALVSLPAWAETGKAVLNPTGPAAGPSGEVFLEDTEGGLRVRAEVRGAVPGKHGFHIHEFGACGDSGNAAGGHYNPAGHSHGNALESGPAAAHAGDLGNIEIGPDGTGRLEALLSGVKLAGATYTVAGRSFILHEKEDDFGQPTGNAGGRSACGTVVIVPAS